MHLTAIEKIEKEVEGLTVEDKLDLLENIAGQLKKAGLQDKAVQNHKQTDVTRFRGIYKGRDLNLGKEINNLRNEWERNS
jgi:hypothetical protein